jgi:TRAP-type C4-dicarboxylate transport system substrate-binding protein
MNALDRRAFVASACAVLLPGCTPRAPVTRLSFSSSMDMARSGSYVWMNRFSEGLRAGGVTTELYPNSTLGREEVRIDMARLGLLALDETGAGQIATYAPLYDALTLPFLFEDYGQFDRFLLQTGFLDEINRQLVPYGLKVVDVAILGGMSGLFNTRQALRQLADFAGLRIRAREHRDLMLLNSWGIRGTQVAWEEIAQALETGIAEGYINPPLVPLIFGHAGQIRHFCDLGIYPSSRTIVMSRRWYERLAVAQQRVVDASVEAARQANRSWAKKVRASELSMLTRNGIEVSRMDAAGLEVVVARARASYAKQIDIGLLPAVMRYWEASR